MNKMTVLAHLNACAAAAKDYTSGLVGQLADTTTAAIEEVETVKADKAQAVSVTIPASGWESDAAIAAYPNYYDIPVTAVTAADRATVTVAPNSQATAIACGLCPTNETLAGKIRIRSASVPAATISAEYWIEQGKES